MEHVSKINLFRVFGVLSQFTSFYVGLLRRDTCVSRFSADIFSTNECGLASTQKESKEIRIERILKMN